MLTARTKAIVTVRAGTHHLRMVDSLRRPPYRGGMTGFTQIRCGDMRSTFSGGRTAVVTAKATSRHPCMIKRNACPGRGRMTAIASGACRQVGRSLSGRNRSIVTTGAEADDLRVVDERDGLPNVRAMTCLAGSTRRDMGGRLTGRTDAVVTLDTAVRNAGVIKARPEPCGCYMTTIAFGRRRYVTYAFSSGHHAIVAR